METIIVTLLSLNYSLVYIQLLLFFFLFAWTEFVIKMYIGIKYIVHET